jgi:hypothetical protein
MLLSDADAILASIFDANASASTQAVMRGWMHAAVREAVAEAEWRKVRRELGPTVAGTSSYEVDEDVVAIRTLQVAGSRPYTRCGAEEMIALQAGLGVVFNSPGAFSPEFEALAEDAAEATADGDTSLVTIWPAPTASGQAITALCAVQALAIGAGTSGATVIGVPDDLARAIVVDGAQAIGWETALGRPDLAQAPRARYDAAKQMLERRGNSRMGRGPIRVPIVRGR